MNNMKKVKVTISRNTDDNILVEDGMLMGRAFIKSFNILPNKEVLATMKIYKNGKIVIEKIRRRNES